MSLLPLYRRYVVAANTINRWKSELCGVAVSEAKRLLDLDCERQRLGYLLAKADLDKAAVRELPE